MKRPVSEEEHEPTGASSSACPYCNINLHNWPGQASELDGPHFAVVNLYRNATYTSIGWHHDKTSPNMDETQDEESQDDDDDEESQDDETKESDNEEQEQGVKCGVS